MKKIILLLLSIFTFSNLYSCDYDEMSFLWWYFKSDLICSGRIIKVYESDSATYDVLMVPDKIYKGESIDTLLLTVDSYHRNNREVFSDCDVYMYDGEKWLIYAQKIKGKYITGGQWSRSNRLSYINKFHPNDFKWMDSVNYKVTDFYWNWKERDKAPIPKNIDSIIFKNFNLSVIDTTIAHDSFVPVLCNIEEDGKLGKVNLFLYRKGFKKEITRSILEKTEYLNPDVECFTDFQSEAIRVTKLIKDWSPAIFCNQKVKSQVLLKYYYYKGKLYFEISN